jgi:hypothetical protein
MASRAVLRTCRAYGVRRWPRRGSTSTSLSDLLNLPDGLVAIGEAERLGPITTSMIKDWLGATRATIVPVLHLGDAPTAEGSVDEHDPPDDRREAVILRDRHCVFPWCTVDARACDLDHIESYVPSDEGGPSGQTAPAKLACLCRRHHNAKTSRRWRYVRKPRRHLHLARSPRPHLRRHTPRHHANPARLSLRTHLVRNRRYDCCA